MCGVLIDRSCNRQAKLDTLEEDLGLVGTNFNVAVSILNVGWVALHREVPG